MLERLADERGLSLAPPSERDALGELAACLARVPRGSGGARGARAPRLAARDPLEHRSRLASRRRCARSACRSTRRVVASEIGSYKPAHGHWRSSSSARRRPRPARPRRREPLPRHRPGERARACRASGSTGSGSTADPQPTREIRDLARPARTCSTSSFPRDAWGFTRGPEQDADVVAELMNAFDRAVSPSRRCWARRRAALVGRVERAATLVLVGADRPRRLRVLVRAPRGVRRHAWVLPSASVAGSGTAIVGLARGRARARAAAGGARSAPSPRTRRPVPPPRPRLRSGTHFYRMVIELDDAPSRRRGRRGCVVTLARRARSESSTRSSRRRSRITGATRPSDLRASGASDTLAGRAWDPSLSPRPRRRRGRGRRGATRALLRRAAGSTRSAPEAVAAARSRARAAAPRVRRAVSAAASVASALGGRRRQPDRRDAALRAGRHASRLPVGRLREAPVGSWACRACRAKCPDCRTNTAVAIGPDYECHSCGRAFAPASSACRGPGVAPTGAGDGRGGGGARAAVSRRRRWSPRTRWPTRRLVLASELPERPLVLGGCCCSHVGAVEGLATRHDRLAVVWIDAHGDLNTPETSPSGNEWGMPLRMIVDGGAVDPRRRGAASARATSIRGERRVHRGERPAHRARRRRARARRRRRRLRRDRRRRPRPGRGRLLDAGARRDLRRRERPSSSAGSPRNATVVGAGLTGFLADSDERRARHAALRRVGL